MKINLLSTSYLRAVGIFLIALFINLSSKTASAQEFKHPGILHSEGALQRIKSKVAEGIEPWKSAYELFNKDARASFSYKVNGPYEYVSRMGSKKGESNLHKKEFEDDCLASYFNAIQWIITGNKKYASKSIEILNAYPTKLKGIINHDKELMSSLCGFLLVNAAEIIRYSEADWKEKDIESFETMVRDILYPVVKDFAPFANGNWDAACIKSVIAFGVFLDDRAMFDKAVEYYNNGEGNGRLTYYVINEAGQCQESGRDQAHTQFGLGCLAEACEVAYNQGVDLYGAKENRLFKGFEYTAKYNLGFDVPFQTWLDRTGKYHHTEIASHDRGYFRGVWELVINHYENRMDMNPFYSKMAVEKVRPEGKPWTADHTGYGTLLYFGNK